MRTGARNQRVPALPGLWLVVFFVLVVAVLVGFLATSCAADEATLLQTLKTSNDSSSRHEAAVQLAQLHSLDATRQLVAAAKSSQTAGDGLAALRDESILLLSTTVDKYGSPGSTMPDKTTQSLEDVVDCLTVIGDKAAIDAIGAMVRTPEEAKTDSAPGDESQFPDLLALQLHGVDALSSLEGDALALTQLVDAAALPGEMASTVSIRQAATEALKTNPDAVEFLLQTRAGAGDDQKVSKAIDAALAEIGQPAVEPLVALLGTQPWADEVLAQIGASAVPRVTQELTSDKSIVRFRAVGILLRVYLTEQGAVSTQLTDPDMVPLLIDARGNATYGDERDGAAESVLASIGEPAVKPLMALVGSDQWARGVLAKIGSPAVASLTAALKSKDQDVRFGAADVLVQIQQSDPESVTPLMTALEDNDSKLIAQNYAFYIRLGQAGTEEALIRALNKNGTEQMCVDYLNCGNDKLDAAAREWADNHGYTVFTTPGMATGPQWGEGN